MTNSKKYCPIQNSLAIVLGYTTAYNLESSITLNWR
jgi:hypothetical protein